MCFGFSGWYILSSTGRGRCRLVCQSSEWGADTDCDVEAGRTAHMYTHSHTLSPSASGVFTATLNAVVCSGPSRCQLLRFQCRPDGSFLPLQCDITSCWCVSEEGQEVSGTRSLHQTGRTPSCERKCEQDLLESQVSPQSANANGCSTLPQLLSAPPPPSRMVHWCVSQQPALFKTVA